MERSLEPTPRRRQLAREQGHVAKSRDLAAAALLAAGVGGVMLLGEGLANQLGGLAAESLREPALSLDAPSAVDHCRRWLAGLAGSLLPLLGLLFAVGVLGHVAQSGFLFQPVRAAPDYRRIDPQAGLSRIFSLSGLTGAIQALLKIAVICGVGLWCLWSQREAIAGLSALSVGPLAVFLCQFLLGTTLKVAGALLLLGMADYAWQRWRHEQSLRMTPEEVKEEMRQLQVDPQITSRRKRLSRQHTAERLAAAVRQASCLVVSPDGLAVAVEYQGDSSVPRVTAKGAAAAGKRMRQAALENQIAIVEDAALARLLNRVKSGQAIPPVLFSPVATLLKAVSSSLRSPVFGLQPLWEA